MDLVIRIWDQEVGISLVEKKKVLDKAVFVLDHDLSNKLLPQVDKLLRRNKREIQDVAETKFVTNMGSSYTSARIAQTVANVFNWSKEPQRFDKI